MLLHVVQALMAVLLFADDFVSDALIIGSVIGIWPIVSSWRILPIKRLINDTCALQNHVLAIFLFERCMSASCYSKKLSKMVLLTSLLEKRSPQ